MLRKRNGYTRAREKRGRPKTPAPDTGWVLAELAQLAGISATTVRYYVKQRLLRPMEFRGTITRYARTELLRLIGIQRLKSEGKTTLAQIKQQLDVHTEASLEAWLTQRPMLTPLSVALGFTTSDVVGGVNVDSSVHKFEAALGSGWVETWQRITLLPGLDLMLRLDAPESVRAAAQRICEEHGR